MDQDQKTEERHNPAKGLTGPQIKIWNSRISWRITLSAFLTILTIQVGILIMTIKNQEFDILDELREIGRSSIASVMEESMRDLLSSPISDEKASRVLSSTIVTGMAVYSTDLNLLGLYGDPVSMVMLDNESLSREYRSNDGRFYEVVYKPGDLQRPYVVVARLNSEKVGMEIFSYVEQTVLIMLLMSAFVTSVLMITLGRWLLEPILFLRGNLLSASENPESPDIPDSPFDEGDEIGGAIALAQRLIRQNADNIKQIKTAAEDKIHKLAYYDTLTGLPNRTLFLQQLSEQARHNTADGVNRFAVVALDLDHFKDVNDSMGHNIGDAILRAVGKRLRSAMPEAAVVARTGEDEYAITVPLASKTDIARDAAVKIKNVIAQEPFKVF